MSSTVKAALISAGVFVLIVVGYFLFIGTSEPPLPPLIEPPVSEVIPPESSPAPDEPEGRRIESVVQRDAVEVTVTVVEKRTGKRLTQAHARVFKSSEGDRRGSVLYDSRQLGLSTGVFKISLKPGGYTVHVQCPRYTGERQNVTVIKDTPLNLDFALDRGHSISGRVLAADGGGIGGARVVAMKELGNPDADIEELLIGLVDLQSMTNQIDSETLSAEDGSYQLDGLKTEWYTVRAIAGGYASNQVDNVPAPRERVDIVLPAGSELCGMVREAGGGGLQGATLHAYPHVESKNIFDVIISKARPAIDSASSDESGRFCFETLGSGVFNFLATAPGYQSKRVTKFPVRSGGPSRLDVVLEPGLIISGYVEDPNGNPVTGARVRAQRAGGGATPPGEQVNISFDDGSVRADDQGHFVFDTLEDGKYTLLCWHDEYQTVRRQGVHPGKDEVTLKLDFGGRITGYVTDLDGRPVMGAKLSATDVADLRKEAVTQDDGQYTLTGLTAGSRPVQVTVSASGYARVRHEVRVNLNVEVEQSFQLQPTGGIRGRVVTSAGDPVSNARVMVRKAAEKNSGVEQTVGSGFTDRQGGFEIAGVESHESLYVRVKKAEYLEAQSQPFSLSSGGTIEVPPVVLRLGGAVAGRVLGADSQPVTGCVVTVKHEGDTELNMHTNPSASTNARGEFRVQGLQEETVSLVVNAPRYLDKEVAGIAVQEGLVNNVGDLVLDKGNSIGGLVVNSRGDPVGGARIIVMDYSVGLKELSTTTDADGRFAVDSIKANDRVGLEISHADYSRHAGEDVDVGTTDLRITLGDLARIRGRVVAESGGTVQAFSVHPQYQSERRDPRKQLKPRTFTGESGDFEFKGVSAGTYDVQVSSPEFAAMTLPSVRVDEGQTVDLGEIVLKQGGIVSGRVLDTETGEPMSRVRVQIVQGQNRFNALAEARSAVATADRKPVQFTDAAGRFKFVGLKKGELSLRVSYSGFVSQRYDGIDPGVATTSQDITLEISRGGDIRGVVVDAAGKPKANMSVYLIGESPSSNQSTTTDRKGQFRFAGVGAGVFTVKAHQFRTSAGERQQAEVSVELAAGGRENVLLELR